MSTEELQHKLEEAGYISDIAEALAENNYTVERAALLSRREVMDYYLTWNGIIGYTGSILNAVDALGRMGHK